MKTIIISAIVLFLLLSIDANAQYKWTDIQYHFQTGSVPPPYYYEYDIYLNVTGTGSLAYHTGYGNDSTRKDYYYDLKLTSGNIKTLNKEIKRSKVLTDTFEEMEQHPIGGSVQNVFVVPPQDPRLDRKPPRIQTPYFPASDTQKKALERLYTKIKAFVPPSVWDDIESKKNK
jgi:hypothetical protein